MGKTKRGKGTKLVVALADASGLPISVCAASASPHEVTLVGEVLAAGFLEERPERLIGERAYDSDPLDAGLAEEGIEMIAPHRRNRKKPKTQDGRKLRRYKRRWKIFQRLFSLGSTTSGEWWCATSDGCRTSWASRSWGASLYCSGVFEMTSRSHLINTNRATQEATHSVRSGLKRRETVAYSRRRIAKCSSQTIYEIGSSQVWKAASLLTQALRYQAY